MLNFDWLKYEIIISAILKTKFLHFCFTNVFDQTIEHNVYNIFCRTKFRQVILK